MVFIALAHVGLAGWLFRDMRRSLLKSEWSFSPSLMSIITLYSPFFATLNSLAVFVHSSQLSTKLLSNETIRWHWPKCKTHSDVFIEHPEEIWWSELQFYSHKSQPFNVKSHPLTASINHNHERWNTSPSPTYAIPQYYNF